MLFLYFLMLVSAVDARSEPIIPPPSPPSPPSPLEDIKSLLSAVNQRLDRIEEQQKTTKSIYSRHEERLNCLYKEQSESFLWQKYIVWLVKEQQVNDQSFGTQQNAMMSQLNQLVSNTNRCCRDNIKATCVGFASAPLPAIQPPATPAVLQDCKAVADGVYQLAVGNEQIPVYCEDGFVTFQRRYNGELNFDRTFSEYEQGFGKASSEHWMGLRYLHMLTKDKKCTFRVRLDVDKSEWNTVKCGTEYKADCNGKIKEIVAHDFHVSSAAEKYKVNFAFNHTNFQSLKVHHSFVKFNGQPFTAKDQDNDAHSRNCAAWVRGVTRDAGFWYHSCHPGHPNAVIKSERYYCSNAVCGTWYPYYVKYTLMQFSC